MDKTEGGPISRNWKQGLSSKQIIIYKLEKIIITAY